MLLAWFDLHKLLKRYRLASLDLRNTTKHAGRSAASITLVASDDLLVYQVATSTDMGLPSS